MKSKPILVALIIGGALVALAAFSISFHGLYLFAEGPMDLDSPWLRAALPIGLDIGQLMAAGTAIIVSSGWPRIYAWGVTVLAVGLSGAGNYWSAHVRDLGMAGALAPMIAPAFLALVAELLVFVWREMYPLPKPEPAPVVVRQVQPKPAKVKVASADGRAARVQALKDQKLTQKDVAKRLGVSIRTVAREWNPEPSLNGQESVA